MSVLDRLNLYWIRGCKPSVSYRVVGLYVSQVQNCGTRRKQVVSQPTEPNEDATWHTCKPSVTLRHVHRQPHGLLVSRDSGVSHVSPMVHGLNVSRRREDCRVPIYDTVYMGNCEAWVRHVS